MSTKLSYKKAKKFLNILNEESAVYIDDKENDLFEGGSLISSPLGGEMHRLRYYVVISTKKGKVFIPH